MNLNFVFQGCQILMVRVAISRSDVIAQTQFQHRMMGKLPAYNTPLSESMGSFVIPFSLLCPGLCICLRLYKVSLKLESLLPQRSKAPLKGLDGGTLLI